MTNFSRTAVAVSAGLLIAAALGGRGRAASDVTETRKVGTFDRIDVRSAFTAVVTVGGTQTRVAVTGSPDVVRRVTTAVERGTLVVTMREGGRPLDHAPSLTIAVPALRGFSNGGAGTATISGIAGRELSLALSGAGSITATGRARQETISLDGTGTIDATGVAADDATVSSSGVGSVHVRATGTLAMDLNGVGEIRYAGKPAHIESNVNGVGRIAPL